MIQSLNVNLARCDCDGPHTALAQGAHHTADCASIPVPVTCAIPRTVEFTVRPGECTCGGSPVSPYNFEHRLHCPARTIRVSCLVAGETWEGSEVEFAATSDGGRAPDAAFLACRERWAQVKAAVLGRPLSAIPGIPPGSAALIARRDAVYAGLTKTARAEEALYAAHNEALRAIDGSSLMVPEPHNRPSARALERYVTQLIAKIGAMS